MKIWLDLRFINNDLYSKFVLELTKELIIQKNEHFFVIYNNNTLKWFNFKNVEIKTIKIKNKSFKEQTLFLKVLKKDKNNLMIFFNHLKPIFYVWNYITVLASFKDIYYSNFKITSIIDNW